MKFVLDLLQPFTRADPLAWFAFYKQMSVMASLTALTAGVLICAFGPGPLLRVSMVPPAAIAGVIAGPQLAQLAQYRTPYASIACAAALVSLALLWPPLILFIASGSVAGLVGGELAGQSDYWAGFALGFLIGGGTLMAAYRFMSTAIAGVVGGYFTVLGAVSLASYTSMGASFARMPSMLLAAVGFVACVTLAWHLHFAPDPEEKKRLAVEAARKRAQAKEDRERMKRFEAYDEKARKRRVG